MAQSTNESRVPAAPGAGARLMALLGEFTAALGDWPGVLYQLDETELGDLVGSTLRASLRLENVAALATADALSRGTVAKSTATGAPAWVARHAAGVDPSVVRRVGAVGVECADPRNAVVAEALATGSATVPVAAAALRELPQVLPQLRCADREDLLGRYLSLTSFGPRALRELSIRILGEYAPERLVRDEETQQECESVFWADLPSGLTRFVAELSGGHAAVVKHALRALSAPTPASGLTSLSNTGDAPSAGPLLETATTVAERVLYAGLRKAGRFGEYGSNGSGSAPTHLPGIGHATDGEHLDAGTLRRLACDADIIPAVLGGESEPLDVGRAKRLFTGGLRTAIIHRDRHCTFPGCDRPPDWCDAHHVRPWWAGGETKLTNAALLCARHHTVVHRDLLTARATPTGVTWDLTPGRMPTQNQNLTA